MNRNKLYSLLVTICLAGYIWLAINHHHTVTGNGIAAVCLFKHITGIPCPSCGSTRAVMYLLNGDISGSLHMNPAGLLIVIIMVVMPLWIAYDLAGKKKSFYFFYRNTGLFFNRKPMAIAGILLVLANWVWNISKGL